MGFLKWLLRRWGIYPKYRVLPNCPDEMARLLEGLNQKFEFYIVIGGKKNSTQYTSSHNDGELIQHDIGVSNNEF
jgi:hypothetical protein